MDSDSQRPTVRSQQPLAMSSASASGLDDPRLGTLSPWLWVPWTLLFIYLLLWFSFKRDHFIQTYHRLVDHVQSHLLPKIACLPKRYSRHSHRIRLNAQDVEASLGPDDSDSEADGPSATGGGYDDGDDELPSTSSPNSRNKRVGTWHFAGVPLPPVRAATSQVLDTLGWTGAAGPSLTRALWGTRDQDRTGRIRLGGMTSASEAEDEAGRASGAVGLGAMWSRVTNLAAGARSAATAGYEAVPSAGGGSVSHHQRSRGGNVIFGVGEEDAVELPHNFSLGEEEQELPEWNAGKK